VPSDISHAINDAVLRRLAGGRSYQRGRDYYTHGHVDSIESDAEGIHAVVRGTNDYTVTLSADEGILDYSCDCPQAADGSFCKHCVAAALAWLNRDTSSKKGKAGKKAKAPTLADAAKILQAEDKETLVRMVMDWANKDAWLRERLLQHAARRSGPESGVAAARRAFERAVRVQDYIPYREASGWARGVSEAIGDIWRLLEDGQAAAVIELCESALEQLIEASGAIDDSDGHLTILRDGLQDLHFRACHEARPDPVALARRLLHRELQGGIDVFSGAAERYATILGAKGLKEYRRLAEAEWEKVPARTASNKDSGWVEHFRITRVMESLARASGDVEELAAVMSRDLSHAYDYLRIAEVYREAGRKDDALLWAEKGLKAFPERTDGRLREFAAEEYHRRRRHEDAMKLMWAEFSERPYLGAYKTLERHAKKARSWPEWRDRALAEIRGGIAKAKEGSRGRARHRWVEPHDDHSQLVEIFLYERDTEAAWREAQEGGCSDGLWLRLAGAREKDHPAEAAPIYLRRAEAAVAETRNGRYDDSVDLLVKAAAVMKGMGRGAEFVRHLEALRVKYKIKRNFIKLIEQKRKSLYLA
jgi:uncharacterized Zn finger protein